MVCVRFHRAAQRPGRGAYRGRHTGWGDVETIRAGSDPEGSSSSSSAQPQISPPCPPPPPGSIPPARLHLTCAAVGAVDVEPGCLVLVDILPPVPVCRLGCETSSQCEAAPSPERTAWYYTVSVCVLLCHAPVILYVRILHISCHICFHGL